jgi:MFS family permease
VGAAFSPLRSRNFRLLFFGQTISGVGDKLLPVALSFGVLELTGSFVDLGLVIAAAEAPNVVLMLVAGVWADRLPRQRIMLASDLVRAAAQAGTAAIFLLGIHSLTMLIALQVVYGVGDAFFAPASTGLTPRLVERDQLQKANSLLHLTRNLIGIGGPAAAGLLVVAANPGIAMVVDSATFLGSAAFLARLHLPGDTATRVPGSGMLHELRAGWHEFSSRSWVWASVACFGLYQLALFPAISVLGPLVSKTELGGAGAWAAILTAGAIGSIGGNLLALRFRPHRLLLASHTLSMVAGLPLLLLAAGAPAFVVAAANGVSWMALTLADTLWFTALQSHIPDEALSRVSSYDWFGSIVLNPVGFVLIGPVATSLGVDRTLVIAGSLVAAAPLAALSLRSVRTLRRLPARPAPA